MGVEPPEQYSESRLLELQEEYFAKDAAVKRYRFWAEDRHTKYTVRLKEGEWACTCNGYAYRGECKHIEMGKEMLSYEDFEEEEENE